MPLKQDTTYKGISLENTLLRIERMHLQLLPNDEWTINFGVKRYRTLSGDNLLETDNHKFGISAMATLSFQQCEEMVQTKYTSSVIL